MIAVDTDGGDKEGLDQAAASKGQQTAPLLTAHTFDEALAASKLLMPPVAPGETGNEFYTTQPFQLLSWYPRYEPEAAFFSERRPLRQSVLSAVCRPLRQSVLPAATRSLQ